jgi:hypothetical protein
MRMHYKFEYVVKIFKAIGLAGTFAIIVLAIFLGVYNSNTIMFKYIDLLDLKTGKQLKLMDTRNQLLNNLEKFNPLKGRFISDFRASKLDEYNVLITQGDLRFFNGEIQKGLNTSIDIHKKSQHMSNQDNNFSSVTNRAIYFNDEEFEGKIKLHGKTNFHWQQQKKSYAVRLKKGEKINKIRDFIFVIPDEQLLATLFSYDVARLHGYMDVKADVVRLKFNNINQGTYIFEEKLSKDLLRRNGYDSVDVIKVIDDWSDQYMGQHVTLFTNEEAYTELKNYSRKDDGQLVKYRELIKHSSSFNEIKHLIDLDRFAKHEAMRMIFGDNHAVAGDNISLIYDTTSKKFFPYFRMEGYLEKLKYATYSRTFDKGLNTYYMWEIGLFKILNKNQEFRTLRNKYLHKIIADAESLVAIYDKHAQDFSDEIIYDYTNNLPSRWYENSMIRQRENLIFNLNELSRYLDYTRVYASIEKIDKNDYLFIVSPDSNSKLSLQSINFAGVSSQKKVRIFNHQNNKITTTKITDIPELLKDVDFSLLLDDDLEVAKNPLSFTLTMLDGTELRDLRLGFRNDITQSNVSSDNIYISNMIDGNKASL